MNLLHISVRAVAILVFSFIFVSLAQAQATRTWVSGVGDDANPCSRTAPCKTFAGAISKTATGGEISVLDPGGFGAVTITKSITIDGAGTLAGILAAGTNGIIINITATTDTAKTVRLRNLSINGASTGIIGIRVMSALKVYVENLEVDGFSGDGISVESGTPANVFLLNSTFSDNQGSGIDALSGGSQIFMSGVSVVFNNIGLSAPGGSIISFQNNPLIANKSNGSPTSTTPLR